MYEIYVRRHFSAAHHLRSYNGKCEKLHGHNWTVEVYVACKELNKIGMGIDFRDVKTATEAVLKNLDHTDLNEVLPFKEENPTSENIARYIYSELSVKLNSDAIKVSKVMVRETPESGCFYWE